MGKMEKGKECNHTIGNNISKEVYIWKGRNPTPLRHYTTYVCELCGEYCRIIYTDATYDKVEDYKNYYR